MKDPERKEMQGEDANGVQGSLKVPRGDLVQLAFMDAAAGKILTGLQLRKRGLQVSRVSSSNLLICRDLCGTKRVHLALSTGRVGS